MPATSTNHQMAVQRAATKTKASNLHATIAPGRPNGSSAERLSQSLLVTNKRSSSDHHQRGEPAQSRISPAVNGKQQEAIARKPEADRPQQPSNPKSANIDNGDDDDDDDEEADEADGKTNGLDQAKTTLTTPAPQYESVRQAAGSGGDAPSSSPAVAADANASPKTSDEDDDEDRLSDTSAESRGKRGKRRGRNRKLHGSGQSRTDSGAANANENAHLREDIAKGLEFILQHELVKSYSLSSITSRASLLRLPGDGEAVTGQTDEGTAHLSKGGSTNAPNISAPLSIFTVSNFDPLVISYLEVIKVSVEDLYDVEVARFYKLQLTSKGFDLLVDVVPQSDGAQSRLREAEKKRINEFSTELYNKNFAAQQNKAARNAAEFNNTRISEASATETLPVAAAATPAIEDASTAATIAPITPVATVPVRTSRAPSNLSLPAGFTPSRNASRSSSLVRDSRKDAGSATAIRGSSQRKLSLVRRNPSVTSSFRKSKSRPASAAHRKASRSQSEKSKDDARTSQSEGHRTPQTVLISILSAQNSHENRRQLFHAQLRVGKFLNDAKFPVQVPIPTRCVSLPQYGILNVPYDRLLASVLSLISDAHAKLPQTPPKQILRRKVMHVDGSVTVTPSAPTHNDRAQGASTDDEVKRRVAALEKREAAMKKAAAERRAPFLDIAITRPAPDEDDNDDNNFRTTRSKEQKTDEFLSLPCSSCHIVMMTPIPAITPAITNSSTVTCQQPGQWNLLVREFGGLYALFHRILRPYAATLGIGSIPLPPPTDNTTRNSRPSSGTGRQSRAMALETNGNTATAFWSFHAVQEVRHWLAQLLLCDAVSNEHASLAENALSYCARELTFLRCCSEAAVTAAMAAAAAATTSAAPTTTSGVNSTIEKPLRSSSQQRINSAATRNTTRLKSAGHSAAPSIANSTNTASNSQANTGSPSAAAAAPVRIARGIILGYLNTRQVLYQPLQPTETSVPTTHAGRKALNKQQHHAADEVKGLIFSSVNDLTQCHVGYIVEDVAIAISCLFDLADEQRQQLAVSSEVVSPQASANEPTASSDYCNIIDQFVRGYAQCGATLKGEERVAIKPLVFGWEAMNCVRNVKYRNDESASVVSMSHGSRASWTRLELLTKILFSH